MSGQVTRFLGGSPLAVLVRLLIISFLVGIVLSWLDLHPLELVDWLVETIRYTWGSIFGSLDRALEYLILGAIVVVPLFLLSRLVKSRS